MAPNIVAQAVAFIDQIERIDLGERLANRYPNVDLSTVHFPPFSAEEIIALSARAIQQLKRELESTTSILLPRGFYWETSHQGMAHRHVVSVLQQFTTAISNSDWNTAAQQLELIIGFQITCGFWDRGFRRPSSASREKQRTLFSDLETKAKQLRELLKEATAKNSDLSDNFRSRQEEAKEMAALLGNANTQLQQLGQLLNQASGNDGRLAQILADQEQHLQSTKEALENSARQSSESKALLVETTEQLKRAEQRLEFMEEKAEFVNEIAGTAGAGLLGRKFEARKRVLQKSAQWWMWATVVSLFAAAGWLGFAHVYLTVRDTDVFRTLAANFGLLLPAIFVVGFFAKQFSRVRQFEEEYAFRSSVAMTLSAFAEKLTDSPSEKNKLIVDTVERLYRLPAGLEGIEKKPGFFQERAIHRNLKAAAELIKEVRKSN